MIVEFLFPTIGSSEYSERITEIAPGTSMRRLVDELDEIALHCATLPVQDRRTADEILGYDEHGIPLTS